MAYSSEIDPENMPMAMSVDLQPMDTCPPSADPYWTQEPHSERCAICMSLRHYEDIKKVLNAYLTSEICSLCDPEIEICDAAVLNLEKCMRGRPFNTSVLTLKHMQKHADHLCTPLIMASRSFRLSVSCLKDSVRKSTDDTGEIQKEGMDNIFKSNKMLNMWYGPAKEASDWAFANPVKFNQNSGRVNTVGKLK